MVSVIKSIIVVLFISSIAIANDNKNMTRSVEDDYSTGVLQYRAGDVTYGVTDCGHLSKYVLQNVLDDAIAGEFDWNNMNQSHFKNNKLSDECTRLKNEIIYRQTGIDNNK